MNAVATKKEKTTASSPSSSVSLRYGNDEATSKNSTPAVSLYTEAPQLELSLEEFEELALGRLKILRTVEECKARNVFGEEYRSILSKALQKHLWNARRDVASHFILRAAYCRGEDLRRWFLTQECHLLRYRLEAASTGRQEHSSEDWIGILQELTGSTTTPNRKTIRRVSTKEMERLRPLLSSVPATSGGSDEPKPRKTTLAVESCYFAVPFAQAADLVASRQCYVSKGWAYVPQSKMVAIAVAKFRSALSHSLVLAAAAFGSLAEEHRLGPLLAALPTQSTTRNDEAPTNMAAETALTATNVASHVPHMPLCMQELHGALAQHGKLKYWGRLQYGLFLKAAGLSCDDSLAFFEAFATRIMTTEQFAKQYAYSIRHVYGKEGKRQAKSAYGCRKIILGMPPPPAGETHGCPFRHYDETHLAALLQKQLRVSDATLWQYQKQGHYQLACQRHFELLHSGYQTNQSAEDAGDSTPDVGNHPNAWFAASVAHARRQRRTQGGEGDEGSGQNDMELDSNEKE